MNKLNKYFLSICVVIIIAFNAVLFLSVNSFNKELLANSSFWCLYAVMMLILLVLSLIFFIRCRNKYEQDLMGLFVVPIYVVLLIAGIVLFFFIEKIRFEFILIPAIIILTIPICVLIISLFYKKHVDNIEVKEVEIISMSGLVEYLSNLSNQTENKIIKETIDKLLDKCNIIVMDESNSELKKLEARIYEYALFLKKDLKASSVNNFILNATKMEKLLEQRGNY